MPEKLRTSFSARIVIFILFLVLATVLKIGILDNIAWIVYGASLLLFPCWPKAWDHADHKKMALGCRIAGGIAIVVGLITRFGV